MVKITECMNRLNRLVSRNYKPVWQTGDRKAAFELCNYIRRKLDLPEFSAEKFDKGWQWRTIFAEQWETGRDEFANLVFGWW